MDQAVYEPLQRTAITGWLEEEGYLTRVPDAEGRRLSRPTDRGRAAGIYLADRNYDDRSYSIVMYGKAVQEMIISKIPEILAAKRKAPGSAGERPNNSGMERAAWSGPAAERPAYSGQERSGNSGMERPVGYASDPGLSADPVDRAYRSLGSAILGKE